MKGVGQNYHDKYGAFYASKEWRNLRDAKFADANGLCEMYSHKIVLRNIKEEPECFENLEAFKRKVIRHEVVHAFFAESGLRNNSEYAENEELVDWIAIQFPKMLKVMGELEVLY